MDANMRDAPMPPSAAEVTALRALAWVVGEQERAARFLALTGFAPGTLRRRAGEAEVLGAVLDFLLEDEAALLAFADAAGVAAHSVALARAALPGATPRRAAGIRRETASGEAVWWPGA